MSGFGFISFPFEELPALGLRILSPLVFNQELLINHRELCSQLVNIPFLLAYSNDYKIHGDLLLFYV